VKSKIIDRDLGWKGILGAATALARGAHVKVGILGDSERGGLHAKEPDGKSSPLTVAEIAVVNEYGTQDGKIPARPAHRMTFDHRREEIQREAFRGLVGIVIDRKFTVPQILNAMGLKHATAIKKTITDGAGVPPPNAPSTTARKEAAGEWNKHGKSAEAGVRPLVDTGATVAALSWALEIGTEKEEPKYLGGEAKGEDE
jgi:hypothetical protein